MTEPRTRILPTQIAPELDLPLAGRGRLALADRRPERFTMLVFNRGLHCPVCRAQLAELDRRLDELTSRGIEPFSVSGESAPRAEAMRTDWKTQNVPLAYELSEAEMRTWGLFFSRGRDDHEPPIFNEPAVFFVKPDRSVYYEAILSMPVGRPRLDDLLQGIDHFVANDYPARGGA
ncbi:MAG: redoxin domain-containing protein [Solirubrobacteraceae bacterium]